MAYESEHRLSTGVSNNLLTNANLLGDGAITYASLSDQNDVDYFKVTADGPGLITLTFATTIPSSTKYWNISLLDSAGADYLISPTRTLSVIPLINGANQSDNTLDVDGLTVLPAAGSRFTIATAEADTSIYTVISASALTNGTSTLTLDKAVSNPADNAQLIFDPVSTTIGSTTTLKALVDSAGTYYVKVAKGDNPLDQEYSVTATVTPTEERDDLGNDTKSEALLSGNRMLNGVAMTGNLDEATDNDVWLFTAVNATPVTLTFAAPNGSTSSNDWTISVTDWNGGSVRTSGGTPVSPFSAGAAASASFTTTANTTYLVTVAPAKIAPSDSNYTLKISGASLDLNDSPFMTVGAVSSSAPNEVVNTGVVKNIQASATSSLLLSSLFTASDADAGQALSYIVTLEKPTGSTSSGYFKVGSTSYGFESGMTAPTNVVLSAAQIASAQFFAGTITGDLTLTLQARDNSAAQDGSDYGARMKQTLRTVDKGVTVTSSTSTALQEGSSTSKDTLSVKLDNAPADGETVTVYLGHGSEVSTEYELSYATTGGAKISSLTFDSNNTPQSVVVTAREDGVLEGSHSGVLSFNVVSSNPTSSYNGLVISALTYTINDVANSPASGAVTLSGTYTQNQTITATPSITDADGLGTLQYTWQQSSDGTTWGTIAGSGTGTTHVLTNDQVGKYVRAVAQYTDGKGQAESVASSASSSKVANINDAPTVANAIADQTAFAGSTFSYTVPSNAFNDVDSGDTLTYAATQVTDETGGTTTTTGALGSGGWLTFDANTRTFTATNVTNTVGATFIKVTATDGSQAPVNDVFKITVAQATGTPKVATLLADQAATEEQSFTYTVPSGSFTDTDNTNGTTDTSVALSYIAKLSNGNDLPDWLQFSAANGTLSFSGTPGNSDVGPYTVRVTATDEGNQKIYDDFTITVANVNDAPTLATPATATFTDTVATDDVSSLNTGATNRTGTLAGSDDDSGDTLTYSIEGSAVGNYVTLTITDSTTGSYILTPKVGTDGIATINKLGYHASETFTVKVSDGHGGTASKTLTVKITAADDTGGVNDNPMLTTISTLTGAKEDQSFTISYADLATAANEADVDGQAIRFQIEGVSSGTLTSGTTKLSAGESLTWKPATDANGQAINAFTVKAVDSDEGVSDQAVQVKVNVEPEGYNLSGTVKFWKTSAGIEGVTTRISDLVNTVSATDGTFAFPKQAIGNYNVTPQKQVDNSVADAITPTDALFALKMFVGLNPNDGGVAVSPYQYLAAEVSGDDIIDPTDALYILQMFVGLSSAPAKGWIFAPDSVGSSSMGSSNVVFPSTQIPVNLNDTTIMQLIGIVKGDVDGDWVAS